MISILQIIDPLLVYDNINLGRRIDPLWPDEKWRAKGGRNDWKDWLPQEEMEGPVIDIRSRILITNEFSRFFCIAHGIHFFSRLFISGPLAIEKW